MIKIIQPWNLNQQTAKFKRNYHPLVFVMNCIFMSLGKHNFPYLELSFYDFSFPAVFLWLPESLAPEATSSPGPCIFSLLRESASSFLAIASSFFALFSTNQGWNCSSSFLEMLPYFLEMLSSFSSRLVLKDLFFYTNICFVHYWGKKLHKKPIRWFFDNI